MLTIVVNACERIALKNEPLLYPTLDAGALLVFDKGMGGGLGAALLDADDEGLIRSRVLESPRPLHWQLCVVEALDRTDTRLALRVKELSERAQQLALAVGGSFSGVTLLVLDEIERNSDGKPRSDPRAWELDVSGFARSGQFAPDRIHQDELRALDRLWTFRVTDGTTWLHHGLSGLSESDRDALHATVEAVNDAVARLLGSKEDPQLAGVAEKFRAALEATLLQDVEQFNTLRPSGILGILLAQHTGLGGGAASVGIVRLSTAGRSDTRVSLDLQYLLLAIASAEPLALEEYRYWEAEVRSDLREEKLLWRGYLHALNGAQRVLQRHAEENRGDVAEKFLDSEACLGPDPLPTLREVASVPVCGLIHWSGDWDRWLEWWELVQKRLKDNAAASEAYLQGQFEKARAHRIPHEEIKKGTPEELIRRFRAELADARKSLVELGPLAQNEGEWGRFRRDLKMGYDEQAPRRPTVGALVAALGAGVALLGGAYLAGIVHPPSLAAILPGWISWAPSTGSVAALLIALIGWTLWRASAGLRALAKRAGARAAELFLQQRKGLQDASASLLPRCRAGVARRNLARAIRIQRDRSTRGRQIEYHVGAVDAHLRLAARLMRDLVVDEQEAFDDFPESLGTSIELPKPCVGNALYAPQTCRGTPRVGKVEVRIDGRELTVGSPEVFAGATRISLAKHDTARFGSGT